MAKRVHFFLLVGLILLSTNIKAAVPIINYSPSTNVYQTGTAITTLTPTNSGGAVGATSFGSATSLTGATLNNPRGIAIDASGNVYVTNSGNNTISKYNSSGTYLGTFGSGATMSFPKDLVFDSAGNAYVLNLGATVGTGSVYKYNSSGVYQSTILSGLNYALGLTIDASDNIYVADQGTVTVKKYSASGALLLSLPTTNLSTPLGVAVDASGNIYVANNGSGNITKYNSAGTYLSTLLSGYTSLQTITIDGAGNIYVGDNAATNTVYVYNQSGTLLTSKAVTDPEGIAVDSKGDMFTSSYFSNQVNEYAPTGGYFLNKPLPAGLTFNSTTGAISGTPTTTIASTVYTVTAYNVSGSGNTTVTITVNNPTPYGNYAFQDLITLNTLSLGITSNLANFPALLSIQDNNLIISGTCADKVQNPNGPNYDFAFVSGGSELYYQIESYNQTTGTLLVWVQIPSLTFATNNSITFYFGSKSPPVTHNTAFFQNTWASDYKAVYHFNEASYTGSVTDGTAGAHTGTTSGMTSADLVTGKIGTAYTFDGSTKKVTATTVSITGAFTLSAWVKLGATGLDQKIMTNQTASGGTSGGYKLGVFTTNIPESESGIATNRAIIPNPTAFASGAWHYVQSVYTGATLSTYVDGAAYKTLVTINNPSINLTLYIGVGEGGNTFYFNGIIDEPRVSNIAKTADWIKAEYIDQNNPVTFTTVGATIANTTNAAAISGALTYTWTGATSTDPTVAANWNNTTAGTTNQLPAFNGSATLVIPAGLSNYPSLTANESIYGLTIASGASLNLNGHTLSVACNIYNSSGGQILYGANNSSGITWNGSTATQTYTGTNTANTAQLGAMTINNSVGGMVTISGGPIDIYKTLTISQGNLTIASSPAALTLKSTATQTASVAAIPTGLSITGNVSVERYLTGGAASYRGYRLLSSPVNINSLTAQTSGSPGYVALDYLNTGMLTGGPGTGFDVVTPNPLTYFYNEARTSNHTAYIAGKNVGVYSITGSGGSPAYSITTYNTTLGGAKNTNVRVPVGNAYLVYFVGNTANTVSNPIPNAATVTAVGYLNQGTIPVNIFNGATSSTTMSYTTGTGAATPGFQQLGNPYASTIFLDNVYADNSSAISPFIWELAPSNTFVSYNASTHAVSSSSAGAYIVSGQGFFVVANGTGQSFTFKESEKATNQLVAGGSPPLLLDQRHETTNSIAAAEILPTGLAGLHLQIAKDTATFTQTGIYFGSSWSDKFSPMEDAVDLDGTAPKVFLSSYSSDNERLCINQLGDYNKGKTIKLYASATTGGIYTISLADIKNIDTLYSVYLRDHKLNDSVNLRTTNSYSFNISTDDTTTYGANRFDLVIERRALPLYQLLSFAGQKVNKGVQLNWKTQNAGNYTSFTLQKQISNNNFIPIYTIQSDGSPTYVFVDKNPIVGDNVYRLEQNDVDGNITYSSLVTIEYNNVSSNGAFSVYPNPSKDIINVLVNSTTAISSNYTADIYNTSGVLADHRVLNTATWTEDISNYKEGVYVIALKNTNGDVIAISKFIKTK